ncbi:MAG TPA: hypothetical protein IGR64_04780 [Leptolyngbyaceae cyanobacterium M65_K2018_010]|nr:hypothetical protein [Leptolyngbyaceae cyanobacterium M65_K2018_010]
MNPSLGNLIQSFYLMLTVGSLSFATLLVLHTLGGDSAANASSRDEFPGRRQGGGTHWTAPVPAETAKVPVARSRY